MRISDWSSDVCSSDLQRMKQPRSRIVAVGCLQALEAGIACAHRMFAVSPNIRQPPFLVNGQDDPALRYAGSAKGLGFMHRRFHARYFPERLADGLAHWL